MSYLAQSQDPRRRAAAVGVTVAVHVALGVAIVTGLTIRGFVPEDTFNPPTFPLPEPEPTPTPEPTSEAKQETPTPKVPMPPIEFPPPPLPPRDALEGDDPVVPDVPRDPGPAPFAQPDPPRPTPSFAPKRVRPSNDPLRWITTEDYPAREIRNEVEGTAGYRAVIGTNGRVSACEVTRTSGNDALDAATCKYIRLRARFDPATDETGARVVGTYTGTVRWEIPD